MTNCQFLFQAGEFYGGINVQYCLCAKKQTTTTLLTLSPQDTRYSKRGVFALYLSLSIPGLTRVGFTETFRGGGFSGEYTL